MFGMTTLYHSLSPLGVILFYCCSPHQTVNFTRKSSRHCLQCLHCDRHTASLLPRYNESPGLKCTRSDRARWKVRLTGGFTEHRLKCHQTYTSWTWAQTPTSLCRKFLWREGYQCKPRDHVLWHTEHVTVCVTAGHFWPIPSSVSFCFLNNEGNQQFK